MRNVVRNNWLGFIGPREGKTPFMYADVLNLVTTGVGNLIDAGPNNPGPDTRTRARLNNVVSAAAMAPAMRLPWKNKSTGQLASQSEIAATWTAVKQLNEAEPDFSQKGGFAYQGRTNLFLDDAAMSNLLNGTFDSFNATLKKSFPNMEEWPADAQGALMTMAWALGPGFSRNFPQFTAAANAMDFEGIATRRLSDFRGGEHKRPPPPKGDGKSRNDDNAEMFQLAADVLKANGDRDIWHYMDKSPVSGGSPLVASLGAGGFMKTLNPESVKAVAVGTAAAAATGVAGWGIWKLLRRAGWL